MYVVYGVLVIAMLFIFFLPITRRADEAVRPLRPRAGPGRVGYDNPRS